MGIKDKTARFLIASTLIIAGISIPLLYFLLDSLVYSDFEGDDIRILKSEEKFESYDLQLPVDENSSGDEFDIEEVKNFLDRELKREQEKSYLSEIRDFDQNIKESANSELIVSSDSTPIKSSPIKERVEKSEPEEIDVLPKVDEVVEKSRVENRPKLAIIIDDVAFKFQVKRIKKLGFPVTMSMFPADINHPNTPKFAQLEPVQMIHLPLQAKHFKREEIDTLYSGDSYKKIETRIDQIVQQFPFVGYINNHTGSKFTSDYQSMKHLITILKKRGITFVDSVTTSRTKSRKVCRELGVKCLQRDIFIDNRLDVEYIEKQIRLAVKVAKKYGKAIAIGHPHKKTIKALHNMKEYLLQNVQVVYIDGV
jgi:polysaccharide deacetylase 2 family uncharacterized protein YibQ